MNFEARSLLALVKWEYFDKPHNVCSVSEFEAERWLVPREGTTTGSRNEEVTHEDTLCDLDMGQVDSLLLQLTDK